jgi:WD40 repeat protein
LGYFTPILCVLIHDEIGKFLSISEKIVNCWNISDGKLFNKFVIEVGIISACFDKSKKRLITSSKNGEISFWNYLNGQQLKIFKYEKGVDINCLFYKKGVDLNCLIGSTKNSIIRWNDFKDNFTEFNHKKIIQIKNEIITFTLSDYFIIIGFNFLIFF